MQYQKGLCWIRRDLRLGDHKALYEATHCCQKVLVCFVFDENILNKLNDPYDARVSFIWDSLMELKRLLQERGSDLYLMVGKAEKVILELVKKESIEAVFTNHDYEVYAKERDLKVQKNLRSLSVDFYSFKDQVLFEKDEILTNSKTPFKVFTAYKREWYRQWLADPEAHREWRPRLQNLIPQSEVKKWPTVELSQIGFKENRQIPLTEVGTVGAKKKFDHFLKMIDDYHQYRDYPAREATSQLSVHLRFGTISIRSLLRKAAERDTEGSAVWINELIWRDFYFMILDFFPHVEKSAFKQQYNQIHWSNNPTHFKRWCEGQTGFPLVDAAMRQLNETGWMHNRLRMVVANFLCKLLYIDWRKGEAYFAKKLIDFDLAANNGGWQWSASTGVDACPYFRIFNPYLQSKKFDPEGDFIRKFCPELKNLSSKEIHDPQIKAKGYPKPMINYEINRKRVKEFYQFL